MVQSIQMLQIITEWLKVVGLCSFQVNTEFHITVVFSTFVSEINSMKHILLLIGLISCLSLNAQNDLVFSPINSNDGLSDNRVRSICQLNDGRMVFVTEGLINLYDGVRFKYLHYDDRKSYPLLDYSGWHRVYVDSDKLLWMKIKQRLYVFDTRKEVYIANTDSLFKKQGVRNVVRDIFIDSNKDYWYITDRQTLLYRPKNSNKTTVFLQEVSKRNRVEDKIQEVVANKDQVFLFYESGHLVCYDIQSKKQLYEVAPTASYQEKSNTTMVVFDKNQLYLVGNWDHFGILQRFDLKKHTWELALKTDYWLNTVSIDHKGNCWVSSLMGIWIVNNRLNQKRLISPLHLVDGRTFETEISTQFYDRNGGLWIGTVDRGILYYHPNRFKFRNYGRSLFHLPDSKKISVRSFVEQDGNLFIGTQNGLYIKAGNQTRITPSNLIPSQAVCEMLFKDSRNNIWICTDNKGLYRLKNNAVTSFPGKNSCNYIFEQRPDLFFICTDKGVELFHPEKGFIGSAKVLGNKRLTNAYQLTSFGKNELLGYSDEGLFILNAITNSITFPSLESALMQHSTHHYHCLFTDSRGFVWLGTMNGLFVFNPKNNTIKSFSENEGLVNNSIRSVIEDAKGRIWVSTSKGISCIEVNSNQQYAFFNFNRYDGVIETEFLPRSVYKTSNNLLLWGGLDGFNEFQTATSMRTSNLSLTPLITKFLLFGSEIKQQVKYGGRVLLSEAISSTREIRLKYNQNFIGFEFSALNYVNPTQTYYRYMLEGADHSWNEIQTIDGVGHANYTNLAPGTYFFKVYAAGSNRQFGVQFAEIKVVIKPPFWKTIWAYMLYFLLISGIIISILKYLDRRNKERMEIQKKAELEQLKYTFFTNVSHELRTPLTLIITPLQSIIQKMGEATVKDQLEHILRHANDLLGMVNRLLDFRRLEVSGDPMVLTYCNVGVFVSDIAGGFSETCTQMGIQLDLTGISNEVFANIDKEKMHKIVNNLMSNAVKFTPKGGNIEVALTLDAAEDQFVLQVSDTGVGIPKADLQHIFDRFYRSNNQRATNTGSGIGLHLVDEYVQMHRGHIRVDSELNKGTHFEIHFPLCVNDNLYLLNGEISRGEKEGQMKILVVEDHDEFRAFLSKELAEKYNIIAAPNGKIGLEMAVSQQPDLIVSDVMMPEMTGVEMCQSIKKNVHTSHIPIILLSAKASDLAQIEGLEAGADAYISKPFNMSILQLRIRNLLASQKNRKELYKNAIVINTDTITSNNIDKVLINNALEHIERNLANPSYSVEQLSKDLHMDRTGLYRKLSVIVGQTPSDFMRSVRLKKAAQLLESGLTVSEVAEKVGFGTSSYFTKCFQDEFGIKPSKYKKQEH